MKASILFHKPFILPCETKLTYSMSDGRTGETFFAWYKTFRGKMFNHYDLFPIFREVSKKGTMSNRSTPSLAYFGFSKSPDIDLILPPESVVSTVKRLLVWNGVSSAFAEEIFENISVSWAQDGHDCKASVVKASAHAVADAEDSKESEVSVFVREYLHSAPEPYKPYAPYFVDIEVNILSLPYDIQEKIIIALYDAGEGRKNNE